MSNEKDDTVWYHCHALGKQEWWDSCIRGGKDMVVLCGVSMEEDTWWDFAGIFVTDEYLNYPWSVFFEIGKRKFERCVDCENHPDLPLLVLGGLDE